jgi:hypothetical protein
VDKPQLNGDTMLYKSILTGNELNLNKLNHKLSEQLAFLNLKNYNGGQD